MSEVKKLQKAGDVVVDSILMKGLSNTVLNITPQLVAFEINENIFEHYITGLVTINDSEDLTNFFPIIGMETMEIEFHTPSLGDKDNRFRYKKSFFVYKCSDRVKVNDRAGVYQLSIISIDALMDKMQRISKVYRGEGLEILQKIFKEDLASEAEVVGEKTQNQLVFISNYWHPSKCIDYICNNSVSEESNSSSYLFFEDRNGYIFTTLNHIFAMPQSQEFNMNNYSVQPGSGSENSTAIKDINADYQSILQLDINSEFNYFDRVKNGYYGGEIISYDLNTQQYIHKRDGFNFEWQNHLNIGKPIPDNFPVSSNSFMMYRPYVTQPFTVNEVQQVSGLDDTNIKYKVARQQHLAQLGTTKLTIRVHGRADYTVGQVVLVTIEKDQQTLKQDDVKFDVLTSGRYIVAGLKHVVNHNEHICYLNLMKDSYIADMSKSVYDRNPASGLPASKPVQS